MSEGYAPGGLEPEDRTADDAAPEDKPPEDVGQPAPQSGFPQSDRWDGSAAGVPTPDGEAGPGDADRPGATDEKEESFDYDNHDARSTRFDLPRAEFVRDLAGRDINNYYLGAEKREPGRIPVIDLARARRVHVTTPSDARLQQSLLEARVVFARGGIGTGRRASATVVLDELTGMSQTASKVTVLESLADRLEFGCGHLLDASEGNRVDTITDAQITVARAALGDTGFLIILVEADSARSLPGTVVDHEMPDLAQVVVFHLAARLSTADPLDTVSAQALIDEACAVDTGTARWYEEITGATTAGPAEAVLLAEAIWDWSERRTDDRDARPRIGDFRNRFRYQQAADLLRRGDGADSPLRQSYAISAAVLDGLAVSEVIEGAGELSTLLAEVEHPGAPGHREIFAQPLARWLRHVEMVAPASKPGSRDGTVVKMPSRELSQIVIEVAWRNYDAARLPLLTWLMSLCQEHPDDRVRIRAAQALAVIARHDYALIKDRVLEVWSKSRRPIEHQAAAWLMEAMVLEGTVAEKVRDLLRRWSRSGAGGKRVVAVRAYGTSIAESWPLDAVQGVRISAADPWLGALPELALCEMYLLGLTRDVMTELPLWTRGFPLMRERSGRALVRISGIRRIRGGEVSGPYDLLWQLARAPGDVGIGVPEVAALWNVACRHESSRSAAWQMLGRWAQSCRDYPELRGVFTQLADAFEKSVDTSELHARLGVYRRRWTAYLNEEDYK